MPAPIYRARYQHMPGSSKGNAFNWDDGQASIFTGRAFRCDDSGVASRAVQEFEDKTGRSRGTVFGISKKSDAAAEEFQHRVAQRKQRAPGHYRG